MKPTEMNLCAKCRRELDGALDMEEIPGTAIKKTACAYCGILSYGGRFVITDKKRRKKDD